MSQLATPSVIFPTSCDISNKMTSPLECSMKSMASFFVRCTQKFVLFCGRAFSWCSDLINFLLIYPSRCETILKTCMRFTGHWLQQDLLAGYAIALALFFVVRIYNIGDWSPYEIFLLVQWEMVTIIEKKKFCDMFSFIVTDRAA